MFGLTSLVFYNIYQILYCFSIGNCTIFWLFCVIVIIFSFFSFSAVFGLTSLLFSYTDQIMSFFICWSTIFKPKLTIVIFIIFFSFSTSTCSSAASSSSSSSTSTSWGPKPDWRWTRRSGKSWGHPQNPPKTITTTVRRGTTSRWTFRWRFRLQGFTTEVSISDLELFVSFKFFSRQFFVSF